MSEVLVKCPACDKPMGKSQFHGITLDICAACQGTWFDDGELTQYLESRIEEEGDVPDDKIRLERKRTDPKTLDENKRICPHCKVEMNKTNYGYSSNIIVDVCPDCSGLFADNEESLALAVYTKGNPTFLAFGEAMGDELKKSSKMRGLGNLASDAIRRTGLFSLLPSVLYPLRDDPMSLRFPVATLILLIGHIFVFLLQTFFSNSETILANYAFSAEPFSTISLISASFVHAGVIPFAIGMYFFWIFADNVEDQLGTIKFILFYMAGAASGWLIHLALHQGSTEIVFGSSGAITAVMGAYIVLNPKARVSITFLLRDVPVAAYLFLAIWSVLHLFFGWINEAFAWLYELPGNTDGLSWSAMLGGLLFGLSAALVLKKISRTD